jgi:hypothetical protein
MQRHLIRLGNNGKYIPKDTISLLSELRTAVDEYGSVVKNLRITEKAIEFDIFSPEESSKNKSKEKLSQEFGTILNERDLQESETTTLPSLHQTKEETVSLSVQLFNDQRYWECHETMEQIWRREQNKQEKQTQQGLILAASALVHYQKNENEVCLGMIPRALSRLENWKDSTYFTLNVKLLKERLSEILATRRIKPFSI